MKFVVISILALSVCQGLKLKQNPVSDEYLEYVQSQATTWKAGRNFHRDTSLRHLKRLTGYKRLRHSHDDVHHVQDQGYDPMPEGFELPTSFDAREKWANCPTIREIGDQGSCGSCWAISSVEVMSDRTCIHSGGKKNFHYSTEDLMSCCSSCGFGCNGGEPISAFEYWANHGIVSGGDYNSSQGCVPYEIPPCEHHVNGKRPSCDGEEFDTPTCRMECGSTYQKSYDEDLHKGEKVFLISNNVEQSMYELVTNGPLSACFEVYSDFFSYKSGVYQPTDGAHQVGGHAIRVIGYGEENGVPYWLCTNSWNSDWGDHGLFKIFRGKNVCGIEDTIVGGIPV